MLRRVCQFGGIERNRPNERFPCACTVPSGLRNHGVRRVSAVIFAFCFFGFFRAIGQESEAEILTRCAEIRALPRERAMQGIPVRVRGVVTMLPLDSPASFTVDDGTGIWVGPPPASAGPALQLKVQVGDLVEVVGRTHAGHFAPTIAFSDVQILGRAPLPESRQIDRLGLESGLHDCQRATLWGVVQSAERVSKAGQPSLNLRISTATGHFNFLLYHPFTQPVASLVDAEVSVTGVFISFFNSRREFLGARIFANNPGDLKILRQAGAIRSPSRSSRWARRWDSPRGGWRSTVAGYGAR